MTIYTVHLTENVFSSTKRRWSRAHFSTRSLDNCRGGLSGARGHRWRPVGWLWTEVPLVPATSPTDTRAAPTGGGAAWKWAGKSQHCQMTMGSWRKKNIRSVSGYTRMKLHKIPYSFVPFCSGATRQSPHRDIRGYLIANQPEFLNVLTEY